MRINGECKNKLANLVSVCVEERIKRWSWLKPEVLAFLDESAELAQELHIFVSGYLLAILDLVRDAADGLSSGRLVRLQRRSVFSAAPTQGTLPRPHSLLGCSCNRDVGCAAIAGCAHWAPSVSLR
jgi:hypothetical protein